jgi:two-component system, response regulator RegA
VTEARTLLVVDDDVPFRSRLVRAFADRGFDVTGVGTLTEAVASARRDSPELALVDLRLGDDSGLDVVQTLKDIDATTTIVVLTG